MGMFKDVQMRENYIAWVFFFKVYLLRIHLKQSIFQSIKNKIKILCQQCKKGVQKQNKWNEINSEIKNNSKILNNCLKGKNQLFFKSF